MRISVIISTYNQPAWLELTLRGYVVQKQSPYEIIVADDGSDERTVAVIERSRTLTPTPIRHIWQEDDGFRKCRILNLAIQASTGDALMFTDGDCIPRSDLIAVHHALARPGTMLSGGYIKLPEVTSLAITPAHVDSGAATNYRWLREHGAPVTRPLLRLKTKGAIAVAFDRLTPTMAGFNGHNTLAWREDVVRANGFDERMGYGGQDRELGERLVNAGIRGVQIRHRAHMVHLYHTRKYAVPASREANLAIRAETKRSGRTWAEQGLTEL
ncbi:MAG: glycosyltransferase family 2 protein [Longimicrobiales bacterium]